MASAGKDNIWSVSGLAAAIGSAFERSWPALSVAGEISNYSLSPSGHAYFSIKDTQAQMRCVIFRRNLAQLSFQPQNGQQVQLRAKLSLYQPRGDLQLIVEAMSRPSAGDLHEAFLRLKAKLQAEGLFDSARKRPLPSHPQRIGLVTSAAGAAQHDVAQTLARRAPHIPLLFAPASVQGSSAPAELIAALQRLYALRPDVILLVRGGGSAEDLAAFNDEALARCIAASPVPIVSGVGHESDFSIADFVADVRAATPTAAAELAAPERSQLLAQLQHMQAQIQARVQQRLEQVSIHLDRGAMQLTHWRSHTLQAQQHRLSQQSLRLHSGLAGQLRQAQHALRTQGQSLRHSSQNLLRQQAALLQQQAQQCQHSTQVSIHLAHKKLSSFEQRLLALQSARAAHSVILQRGDGQTIRSLADVKVGEHLHAQLQDGRLDLGVLGKHAGTKNGPAGPL